jgi:hypothetical protein
LASARGHPAHACEDSILKKTQFLKYLVWQPFSGDNNVPVKAGWRTLASPVCSPSATSSAPVKPVFVNSRYPNQTVTRSDYIFQFELDVMPQSTSYGFFLGIL